MSLSSPPTTDGWGVFCCIIGCCCCCFVVVVAFISSENKNKCSAKTDLKFLRDELSHDARALGAPLYLVALLGRRFMRMTMMTATMPMMMITRTPTTAPMTTFMELLGASAVKESWEIQQKRSLLSGGLVIVIHCDTCKIGASDLRTPASLSILHNCKHQRKMSKSLVSGHIQTI